MKSLSLLLAGAAALAAAQPAAAVVVVSGSGSVTTTDPTQTNRVFRNAVASTWATPKAYPGTSSQTPTYYDLINTTYAANAVQAIYYEITWSNASAALPFPFAVAYLNSFVPTNVATNYLGDSGTSSSNNVPQVFQVVVPVGQQLLLNFSNVSGTPANYSYSVAAFSDANRGEEFLPLTAGVPEPATWAMMIGGFGLLGATLRRRAVRVARAV